VTRDVQRSKVYDAEALVRRIYDRAARTGSRTISAYGSTLHLPIERRFASVDSIQRYVDAVLTLNWVRTCWSDRAAVAVQVRERRGYAAAHYERLTATIAIPPYQHNRAWAMRELVVLHELAHHLEPDAFAAAHGPRFVGRFTTLVSEVIGPETGFLLTATMRDGGIQITTDAHVAQTSEPAVTSRLGAACRPGVPDLCQGDST
jgi:putative metallohydrolase (TIGR04338 family)